MPTYGFIQETVEDRYYERGGEHLQPHRALACPACGKAVEDEPSLAAHLGSAHPLTAPRLLVGGEVVVGERLLHQQVAAGDLAITNATDVRVAENGGKPQIWSAQALRDALSEGEQLVLDVTLRNERAGDGASAVERIRLRLDVADPESLSASDEWFDQLLASETLDELRVDRFANETSALPRAARYSSALHDYAVALLIKDAAHGTSDALPFAAHRAKLQHALGVLRHFPERPIARAVCGFVRFSLNDFTAAAGPSGVVELDRCTQTLRDYADLQQGDAPPDMAAVEVGRCPTDHVTSMMLERWDARDSIEPLLRCADERTTTVEDSAKCRALALRRMPRDAPEVQRLARSLVNDPVFGRTAAAMLEDPGDHE